MPSSHISDTRVAALRKQLASRIAASENMSSAAATSNLAGFLPDQHESLCCLSSAIERCAPLRRQTDCCHTTRARHVQNCKKNKKSHHVDSGDGRVGLHRLQKMSSTHISDTRVAALCKQLASRIAASDHMSSATAISKSAGCLPDQHASLCCLSSAPERCAPLTRQTIRDVAAPTALFVITVVQTMNSKLTISMVLTRVNFF